MLLLNSDTEVPPDGLTTLAAAFAKDRTLGIAGAQLWYPNGDPQWSGGPAPGAAWLFFQASGAASWLGRVPGYRAARPLAQPGERNVDWVAGAALAMRREVWERIGPFDEGFHVYAQDLDFCLRAHAAGWRVAVIGPCRVMHHRGATIDGLAGATEGENPEAMWRDLARWADRTHGPAFARRARRALCWGAALRVLGRQAATPFLAADRRETWRRHTAAIRHAIDALRRTAAGQLR
jgi:GT2 family glycosyltransferase